MDRRDRDEPLAHGVEVGALGVLELEFLAPDPVVLLAARIDLLDDAERKVELERMLGGQEFLAAVRG